MFKFIFEIIGGIVISAVIDYSLLLPEARFISEPV